MIRITALNEESESEDSEVGEGVTREALEEIALQQYARTLELQKKGNPRDALQLLRDLLDTELLDQVRGPVLKDKVSRPLLNLKYLCYCNVAALSARLGDREAALEAYLEASVLDDTDVTLWFRLGKMSLQVEKFDLALFAFRRGVDCNPRHWPCLDHLVTVLLGLRDYTACITIIYDALELDPDYFRGKVYRKHIFMDYPHIQEYLSAVNPMYKWSLEKDRDLNEEEGKRLVAEAYAINEVYTQQIIDNKVVERLPVLKINKPIEKETWLSLGESLTDMHLYISAQSLSHACIVDILQPEEIPEENSLLPEPMEVDNAEVKISIELPPENVTIEVQIETEKLDEDLSEKTAIEIEKVDAEQDTSLNQEANKSSNEGKDKKNVTRRRGSSLSFLEQWEWCTKRRSSRKKTANQPSRVDETIYDTLKRLIPAHLLSEEIKPEKIKDAKAEDSMDTMELYKLFEEKEKISSDLPIVTGTESQSVVEQYFGTDKEKADVQVFIRKYIEFKCDIITMIDEFILVLSGFWDVAWPEKLGAVYMIANNCSKQHGDPPLGHGHDDVIRNYVNINLLHLEIATDKLIKDKCKDATIDIELMDTLKMMCSNRQIFGTDALNTVLRFLWAKCQILLHNEQTELALDCLYYMLYEFNNLDETGNSHSLWVPNFTKNSTINKHNCIELLKSLERNKQLATVLSLYESEQYEEVLSILQGSFLHCQALAGKQDWSAMSLDWAVQLVILLEALWALRLGEQCFTFAAMCLHEALKQYMLCTAGEDDHHKWSLTVVKVLVTIEHILKIEGSSYLEILPTKALAKMVQDIVQIIVHQLDDPNGAQEMPLDTVVPWILLHYIFQHEEDCGRIKQVMCEQDDAVEREEIPSSLMVLFTGHDYLGRKGWCCNSEGHLLFFTLDAVIPRLKSPALTPVVEAVSQYLEQNVFCLFGHPSKKTKLRYLYDHNVSPFKLDWKRAQQIFQMFRPDEMPEFDSYRLGSISAETEQLFQRMLALLPITCNPASYYTDVIAFIENKKDKLPEPEMNLPFKMRDIYYLLADFYFKNNETVKALKYYAYDIVLNKNRFDSWAGMALARGSLLETKLNSCETFKTEMEYLNKAGAVECCFKRALAIDGSHSMLWIEYGAFVYGVHSFCSRMLKQDSESLSMESFQVLEARKEDMLDTAHRCFVSAHKEWMVECEAEDKRQQDERWLHYYMLGKISEKKKEEPGKYLNHYIKASKFLLQNNATYPTKINYNNPQNLSVEALEIHYRIHASILKFMEQHENKIILMSDGNIFKECLAECAVGPFSLKKKNSKEGNGEKDSNPETPIETTAKNAQDPSESNTVGTKRTLVDNGEIPESEAKRMKLCDSAGKEEESEKNMDIDPKITSNEPDTDSPSSVKDPQLPGVGEELQHQELTTDVKSIPSTPEDNVEDPMNSNIRSSVPLITNGPPANDQLCPNGPPRCPQTSDISTPAIQQTVESQEVETSNSDKTQASTSKCAEPEVRRTSRESTTTNTATNSSSDSSSSSSSSTSSSDTSSQTSNDSAAAKVALQKVLPTEMSQEEIDEIISICLESLEDCVSRFPQHYKALYRLAHYHFYYKKDKNVERCRDLMLSSFTGRNGGKLQGLFCERKNSNFFNGIWRIPASEVDRPGSFASHMSRCVLITMEVLKEIDDHKTLLDLCLQLQRTPDAEKKYLRDAERGECSQQALSLCIRSLKGQLTKFSSQPDLTTNHTERKALSNLMLDIYRAYQRAQKHLSSKSSMLSSILIESYKLFSGNSSNSETAGLLDLSVKQCQALIASLKQVHTASAAASQSSTTAVVAQPTRKTTKIPAEQSKPYLVVPANTFLPSVASSPKPQEIPPTFPKNTFPQNVQPPSSYLPYLPGMDPLLTAFSNYDQTTAAALTYMSNMGSLAGLAGMAANSYQNDFLRQFMATSLDTAYLQQMKPTYNQSSMGKVKSTGANKTVTRTVQSQPGGIKQSATTTFKQHTAKSKTSKPKSFAAYTASQTAAHLKLPMHIDTSKTLQNTPPPPPVPTPHKTPERTTPPSTVFGGTTSNVAKPAHMPPAAHCSPGGAAKPAHMGSSSSVSTVPHTKPPLPHQQVSPGKTLQEKLAERQKQNPIATKTGTTSHESARSIASTAYSGKIPSSLTITKSVPVKSNAPGGGSGEEQKQANKDILTKTVREIKKSISSFEQMEKLARPKHIIDTSEVIILDDD